MKGTSRNKKSWKEKMVDQWSMLVHYYQEAVNSPSFKRWMKVCLEVCKIVISILFKKVLQDFFEDF